ncbi:MAG: hypothetical protein NVSMB13_02290 [Mycobacteriales bacterium]
MRVAVVGGSVAGLAAGLALARAGNQVTICERDAQPLPPTPEAAAAGWRGGVAQVRQPHGFISRTRTELLAGAPDIWSDLLDVGALELQLYDRRPESLRDLPRDPGDDDLVFLACRRTTFEWVLRRAVQRECDLRLGTPVSGLCVDEGSTQPRVVGVATSGGRIDADVVVDASGRSGGLTRRTPRGPHQGPPPADEGCGIVYASRSYRLRPGARWGPLNRLWAAGGVYGGYSCMLFPQDNDTFSVAFARLPDDRQMAAVQSVSGFERAVSLVPFVSAWVDPERAEPLGPPVPMAGLRNMISPLPQVGGLFAIGDAVCTTDPTFGRGAALAVASAFALARCLGDGGGDRDGGAESYAAWFAGQVAPWHEDSVAQDRARTERWEASAGLRAPDGSPRPPAAVTPALVGAAGITGTDPLAWRSFLRYAGLLELPSTLGAADVVGRVTALLATGWTPQALPGPSHGEMVAAVNEANGTHPAAP